MGLTLIVTTLRRGGIFPSWVFFKMRLSPGLPGTNAGPVFPPRNMLSRVRKSSFASCMRNPWHTVHRNCISGTMSCCETADGLAAFTGGGVNRAPANKLGDKRSTRKL
jgi:hypothetical protein